MKLFKLEVVETVKKVVWVEAEDEDEAMEEAYEEDMEKDIDYIDRQVSVLESEDRA